MSTQVRGDVDRSRPDSARGVVVIVGGSTGIGLACADELARLGRKIVVSRHHHSPPVDRPFLSFPLDLEEIESIDDFCDKVGELPEPILAVIVTAGVRRDRSALRLTRSEFDSTIRVNALGGARVIRSLLPRLLENPRSQVCVVGSVVASIGTAHQLAYVASKAWWVGFVRSLAMEFGERGMTANLVEPGLISTEMTAGLPGSWRKDTLAAVPLGRLGRPADVASVVRFLTEPAGASISGAVVRVDGGLLAGVAP